MHRLIAILTLILATLPAIADVVPVWSTGVAVPGEQVVLYIVDTEVGQDPFSLKEQPKARFASLQVQQPVVDANPMDPNRAVVEILPILVRPDKAGSLQMDDLIIEYRSGRRVNLKVPPLPVRSTAEIKWYTTPFPYGALWYTDTEEGYVHQPVRAALKIFMPGDCYTGALPQMQAVGVKLGTMQTATQGIVALVHSRLLMENTTAFARGQNWRTADYTGEFTPFREGNSDIVGKVIMVQRRGFFVMGQEEVPLPTLTLSALPLPPGAPAQFADTVGQYSISAKTSATSLAMNEAVEVEITVRGTGNLQQLSCPAPDDAEAWKLVPATRKPIVSPNGETTGMIFSQLMRPVAEVGGIPSFTLNYFDPTAMAYKKAATLPIPLPWRETDAAASPALLTQATAPPPAGTVPVAEMTDIYGYVPREAEDGRTTLYVFLPRWLWYLLYLPGLSILAFMAVRALLRRSAMRAGDRARERELTAISREDDGLSFLKRIGSFIESNIPSAAMTPELDDILRQRDEEAFRPGAAPVVLPQQRAGMLKSVRKALAGLAGKALLLALLLLPMLQATDTAEELYNSRQYTKALEELEKSRLPLNAAVPYNEGNVYYRLGKPGMAALYYARALQLDPAFAEARANLAFIQRKEGAILPIRSTAESVFTLLSCRQLWVATVICTAALLFCIALLLLLRHKPHTPWLSSFTVLFAVLSLLCALDWVYYTTRETPDLSSLPPGDIAYVVQSTTARTAASDDSGSVVQLPASTPVHLLALRGSWVYVETTTGVRGWAPAEHVQQLSPNTPPRIPITIRFY